MLTTGLTPVNFAARCSNGELIWTDIQHLNILQEYIQTFYLQHEAKSFMYD